MSFVSSLVCSAPPSPPPRVSLFSRKSLAASTLPSSTAIRPDLSGLIAPVRNARSRFLLLDFASSLHRQARGIGKRLSGATQRQEEEDDQQQGPPWRARGRAQTPANPRRWIARKSPLARASTLRFLHRFFLLSRAPSRPSATDFSFFFRVHLLLTGRFWRFFHADRHTRATMRSDAAAAAAITTITTVATASATRLRLCVFSFPSTASSPSHSLF